MPLEHYAIRSTGFRRWLLAEFGRRWPMTIKDGSTVITIPGAPSSQSLADGLNALEAAACAGPEKTPAIRIGQHDGRVVVDLGRPDWSAVVIGPDGWEVVKTQPAPFTRPAGLRPLPIPVHGGTIGDLRPFLNVAHEDDFRLAVAWLLATLRPTGPFPAMVVNGEQGSAKSTVCRVLRRLVDPNAADLRASPKEERDLLLAARNGWIVGLDNLSYIDADQSDAICRVSTGGGFSTRALYTNSEEVLIDVCRPVLLNGIPSLAARPDLADRSVVLTLPTIPEEKRQTEGAFWLSYYTAVPRILGALFDGVSRALRNQGTVKFAKLPRMADFALWSAAAFPAYGWTAHDFEKAYDRNRERGVEDAVDADPLAAAVLEIAHDRGEYLGTATALLGEINAKVTPEIQRDRTWPKDGARLSNRLRRVAPALRKLGVEVELDQHIGRGVEKKRAIRIRRASVGTVNAAPGDAPVSATVHEFPIKNQHDRAYGGAVDAGDDDLTLSSASWAAVI